MVSSNVCHEVIRQLNPRWEGREEEIWNILTELAQKEEDVWQVLGHLTQKEEDVWQTLSLLAYRDREVWHILARLAEKEEDVWQAVRPLLEENDPMAQTGTSRGSLELPRRFRKNKGVVRHSPQAAPQTRRRNGVRHPDGRAGEDR